MEHPNNGAQLAGGDHGMSDSIATLQSESGDRTGNPNAGLKNKAEVGNRDPKSEKKLGSQMSGMPSPLSGNMGHPSPGHGMSLTSPSPHVTFQELEPGRASSFHSPAISAEQGIKPEEMLLPDSAHGKPAQAFISARGSPLRHSTPALPSLTTVPSSPQHGAHSSSHSDPFAEAELIMNEQGANGQQTISIPSLANANSAGANNNNSGSGGPVSLQQLMSHLMSGLGPNTNSSAQSSLLSGNSSNSLNNMNIAADAIKNDTVFPSDPDASNSSSVPTPAAGNQLMHQAQQFVQQNAQQMLLDPRLLVLSANLLLGRLANAQGGNNPFPQAGDNNNGAMPMQQNNYVGNLSLYPPGNGQFGHGGLQDEDDSEFFEPKSKLIDFNTLGLHRTRRKRRAISDLGGDEKWECPSCGKVYCKTSTMSIKRHPGECPASRGGSNRKDKERHKAKQQQQQQQQQQEIKAVEPPAEMDTSADSNNNNNNNNSNSSSNSSPAGNNNNTSNNNSNSSMNNTQALTEQLTAAMAAQPGALANLPQNIAALAAGLGPLSSQLPALLAQPHLYPQLTQLLSSGLLPTLTKNAKTSDLSADNDLTSLRGLGNPASLSINLGPRKPKRKRNRSEDYDDGLDREPKPKKKSTGPRPKKRKSGDDGAYGSDSDADTGEIVAVSDDEYTPESGTTRRKESKKRGSAHAQQGDSAPAKLKSTTRVRGPDTSPSAELSPLNRNPVLKTALTSLFAAAPGSGQQQPRPALREALLGTPGNPKPAPSALLRIMASAATHVKPMDTSSPEVAAPAASSSSSSVSGGPGIAPTLGQLQAGLIRTNSAPKLKPFALPSLSRVSAPALSPVVRDSAQSSMTAPGSVQPTTPTNQNPNLAPAAPM